ncbi:MAG: hypothetical protein KGL95_08930 [Patescibacteria group bacterium]|nr:hypothetical protein [Patescibacteria group bacterium]
MSEKLASQGQLDNIRTKLMQEIGGIFCYKCKYNQFPALTIAYKDGRKGRKALNITQYNNYLKNLENAKNDLEVLCSNCLQTRVRSTRSHDSGSEYTLYGKKYDIKQRQEIMNILDQHKCIKCGHDNLLSLQIGHIKEGISQRFKLFFKSKRKELKYYIQNPDKAKQELHVLCANCVKLEKDRLATEIMA